MHKVSADVARMLENYQDLIQSFAIGDISADVFERDFLARFKQDTSQVVGKEFDVLDRLFAEVDAYVSDPTLRATVGGLNGEELRHRACDAYAHLYDKRV